MKNEIKEYTKDDIKVGFKFHYWDKDLWHVVSLFKDNGDDMVVIKSWAKYKQRWCYKVDYVCLLVEYLNNK